MVETKRFSFIRKILPHATKKNAQKYSKYEKMRLVCEELGPTFVKFGQILSNRPDLLPAELIIQFEKLQDSVPPQPGAISRKGLIILYFLTFFSMIDNLTSTALL